MPFLKLFLNMSRFKPTRLQYLYLAAFSIVLMLRIYLCTQAPVETSDLYRNLGYGWQMLGGTSPVGFEVYQTHARDFAPEFWTRFWTDQGYIYPPVTYSFFAAFAATGLGLFWVKLALTLCDVLTVWLVRKEFGALSALLVFAAPMGLWYSAHEGQFESLVCVLSILAVVAIRRQRYLLAGLFFVLSLQSKQFAALTGLYVVFQLFSESERQGIRHWLRFALGCLLGFLPFSPFYWHSPGLYFAPFQTQSMVYNPFHWDFWQRTHAAWNPPWLTNWNALTSYGMIAVLGFFLWVSRRGTWTEWTRRCAEASPVICFWILIKSLSWAQFWYPVILPSSIASLQRFRKLALVLFVLYFASEGRSWNLISQHPLWGVGERPETVQRFENCMWTCDYSATLKEISQ